MSGLLLYFPHVAFIAFLESPSLRSRCISVFRISEYYDKNMIFRLYAPSKTSNEHSDDFVYNISRNCLKNDLCCSSNLLYYKSRFAPLPFSVYLLQKFDCQVYAILTL